MTIISGTRSTAVVFIDLSDEQRSSIRHAIRDEWNILSCDDEWDYGEGLVDCNVPTDEAEAVHQVMQEIGSEYYLSEQTYCGTLRLVAPLNAVAAYLVDVTVQWAMEHWSEDGSDASEIIDNITDSCDPIQEVLKDREVFCYDPTRDYAGIDTFLRSWYGEQVFDRIIKGQELVELFGLGRRNWTCEGMRNVADWDDEDDPICLRIYRAKWIRVVDPALGIPGCQFNDIRRRDWDCFLDDLADETRAKKKQLYQAKLRGELGADEDIDELGREFRLDILGKAECLIDDVHLDWT